MFNLARHQTVCYKFLLLFLITFSYFPTPLKAATYYVAKSNPAASDSNTGTEAAPWKTIQKAASTLVAGDTVYVKAGIYTELFAGYPDTQIKAIKTQNSGQVGKLITYSAYPGDSVVIDQQNQGIGFYTPTKHYITIKGFEIKNCYGGGILTEGKSSNIIVENNHIHNINGASGSNNGGIRFNGCSYCAARNNTIHDVFVNGTNTTFSNGANGAGIHSFSMEYTTIENNEIYNVYSGVFHKQSSGNTGATIKANLIHDAILGIFYSDAGGIAHKNQVVTGNIIYNVKTALQLDLNETSVINDGFKISNNVIVATLAGINIVNVKNVEIYNNIFVGPLSNAVFNAKYDDWYITYFDNNIYYNIDKWWTNTYSSTTQQKQYSNLTSWQAGSGFDGSSSTNDPHFVSSSSNDYHISSGFEVIGRDGLNIGAYPVGNEVIGVTTRAKPATSLY